MDNWMPPKLKAILTYTTEGETFTTDITGDVTNWNELQTSMQRDGVSGVFMSVDMPIKVAFGAKQILHDLFFTSFLSASASIQILQRDPFDLDTYTQIHAAKLNFSTYKEDADTAEISSEARDFNNLVKSVGKTKYDIPVNVSDGKNPKIPTTDWIYKHNEVLAGGYYTIAEAEQTVFGLHSPGGPLDIVDNFTSICQTISINLDDVSIPLGGVKNDFKSQELRGAVGVIGNTEEAAETGQFNQLPDAYFFMADPDLGATVHLRFKFRLRWTATEIPVTNYSPRFFLHQRAGNGDTAIINNMMSDQHASPITDQQWIDFNYDGILIVPPGAQLRMFIFFDKLPEGETFTINIDNFEYFDISYTDKSNLTETIPAVTQLDFANHLLYRMGDGDPLKTYTATIDDDTDNPWPFDHYLVAAESIRGFENARFHANFNDFLDYMQFLGYEWDVDESTLTVAFKKRAVFFDPTVTALELTEGEVADLQISADDEYAYSTVRVGYEKPDIEDTNGRFAVCGAFDYATDYANTGDGRDSSLEIMCPYKADPVEIETLSWTRGEKTTDQKADNDIFMLAGEIDADGDLIESRQTEYTVTDTNTNDSISWFNVPYIPYFITLRNGQKIGVAARSLKFTGTDAYREASLSGGKPYDIYSDITLPERLFAPLTYEFEAGTHQFLPEAAQRFGLVTFPWKGEQYRGFISKLVKAHNNEAPTGWVLTGYIPAPKQYPITFYGQVTEYKDLPQRITFSGTITETV